MTINQSLKIFRFHWPRVNSKPKLGLITLWSAHLTAHTSPCRMTTLKEENASGITQAIRAFTLNAPEGGGRVLLFISGALSITLGVLAFRHFGEGYAVLLLAIWIGVSFIFQGVAEIVVTPGCLPLLGRGWHVFFRIVSMMPGLVVIAWPFDSIAVPAVVAGVWLVCIGICQIVWAVVARKEIGSLDRGLERLSGAVRKPIPMRRRRRGAAGSRRPVPPGSWPCGLRNGLAAMMPFGGILRAQEALVAWPRR